MTKPMIRFLRHQAFLMLASIIVITPIDAISQIQPRALLTPPEFDANLCIHVYKIISTPENRPARPVAPGAEHDEFNAFVMDGPTDFAAVYFTNVCNWPVLLYTFVQGIYANHPQHPSGTPRLTPIPSPDHGLIRGYLGPGRRYTATDVDLWAHMNQDSVYKPTLIDFHVIFCAVYAPSLSIYGQPSASEGASAISACSR